MMKTTVILIPVVEWTGHKGVESGTASMVGWECVVSGGGVLW